MKREPHQADQDRRTLAHRHAAVVQSVRQLRQLSHRVDEAGPDPHSRRIAAALVAELDSLLPDLMAREIRLLPSPQHLPRDPWLAQAADQLQVDQGWIWSNWYELQPLVDAVARSESWVDPDRLREASEIFCTLVREHVNLVTTLLERHAAEVPPSPPGTALPLAASPHTH